MEFVQSLRRISVLFGRGMRQPQPGRNSIAQLCHQSPIGAKFQGSENLLASAGIPPFQGFAFFESMPMAGALGYRISPPWG